MQKPGNYSVKFCEWASKVPAGKISQADALQMQVFCDLIQSSPHFILPDCGIVLPRKHDAKIGAGLGESLRPPFSSTVIEYEARHGAENGVYDSSRRIVLAIDFPHWSNDGVFLIPVFWIDHLKIWHPPMVMFLLPYEQSDAPGIFIIPFMKDMFEQNRLHWLANPVGEGGTFGEYMINEYRDEIAAYADMCAALSCSNVSTDTIPASKTLNAMRRRKGKPELKSYKVLTINAGERAQGGGVGGGSGASRRAHLRRGHIRNLQSGKRVWVNACFVKGDGGFVDKDYRVVA
jgi:hypothetical protein